MTDEFDPNDVKEISDALNEVVKGGSPEDFCSIAVLRGLIPMWKGDERNPTLDVIRGRFGPGVVDMQIAAHRALMEQARPNFTDEQWEAYMLGCMATAISTMTMLMTSLEAESSIFQALVGNFIQRLVSTLYVSTTSWAEFNEA